MTTNPERIFYFLSAVVLTSAGFVLTPSTNQNVVDFQKLVKEEFVTATIQVFGDQPVFDESIFVIETITEFYHRSADEMIILLTPTHGEDEAMNKVAINVYSGLKVALNPKTYASPSQIGSLSGTFGYSKPEVLGSETTSPLSFDLVISGNFMEEAAIYNIVPEDWVASSSQTQAVDLAQDQSTEAVVSATWVSMKDGVTGQVYCVGIFNSEVNRYLGSCKNDYQ